MTELTPYTSVMSRRVRDGDTVHFEVTPDWLQGRACFGGLVSAFGAQAMRDVAGAEWPAEVSLRGLQTSYVAALDAGRASAKVRLLRQGRNVCQVQAELLQDGRVAAVMLGMYGAGRPSALAPLRPARPAPEREAAELRSVPYLPGRSPPFLQHLETRWAAGALPFTGGRDPRSSIHMRLKDPEAESITPEMMTVLLADVSPTPAVGHLAQPAPSSSVTRALELRPLDAAAAGSAEGWWRADNESLAIDEGYVNQHARLWAPSGALAGFDYQVVAVFG